MKFRNGEWLWAEGVRPHCMTRVTEYRAEGDALYVCGVDRNGHHAVDRFEGTVIQLRVSSPMANVIRVQACHHAPIERGVAGFDLDYDLRAPSVRIDETGDDVTFSSGDLSLRIGTNGPWSMRFEHAGGGGGALVTQGGRESLACMDVANLGRFMTQRLSMSIGECIYGMGERFGPLVKNGQTVAIWNQDGGTSSEQAYKNVPFYLSSRGYGLFVNSPDRVEFEVGTERVSHVQMSVPGELLDYYVFYGPALKDVLSLYTKLSGRPAMPPAWSMGLWLSTSFTTKYDERTVNEFVDGMAQRNIPLSVFHFDCFWMKERHWCDFEWDRDAFPDPEQMIKRLKARGLKVCLWINPYISSLSKLFDEGREKGYFIRRLDGSPYQVDQWQPGMAIVDFTNPDATRWYQEKLRALLDMGVDCFKTDFGERIPHEGVYYHDHTDAPRAHNYYAYLYNKAVFELLEEHRGKGDAIVFARAATAGCQKFPAHWGGDCEATFESMAEDLRGGLSFCLSGAAFWSHDIGGFSGDATPALYKRWVAFGLLSTHSRLHGSGSYRVPWLFDEESVAVLRHFTRLKNRLFPYLFSAARDAHEHGWPVMRAMVLEYPDDPNCRHLDRQYMLGDALLVAPVFRADNVAEYYLPRGRWTHLLTGKTIDGGAWRTETLDFLQIPLFVRENTLLPISADEEHPRWHLADPLTLNVFEPADGADIALRIPTSDGADLAAFRCRRQGERLTIESDGRATSVTILLRSHRAVGKVSNGKVLRETQEGLLIEWTDPGKAIGVALAE